MQSKSFTFKIKDKNPKGSYQEWEGTRSVTFFDSIHTDEIIKVSDYEGSVYVYFYEPKYDEDYNLTGRTMLFHAELKFSE